MCRRYTYYPAEFHDLRLGEPFFQFNHRFNIAPGQNAPVIVAKKDRNTLDMFRWGLIPKGAKEAAAIGDEMINARSETITKKLPFKHLIGKRHCVVLANGFYKWRREGKQKIPLHFKLKSGESFTFPGLWDTWRQPDGTTLSTYTLLTTTANGLVGEVYDRMPVIFETDAALQWLACVPKMMPYCFELMKPFPAEQMTAYEVSPLVNNSKIDSPECVKPI
jgi:putative SOS response-associated peptidase YedK